MGNEPLSKNTPVTVGLLIVLVGIGFWLGQQATTIEANQTSIKELKARVLELERGR